MRHLLLGLSVGAIVATLPRVAAGQPLSIPAGATEREIIASAEREGSEYQRSAPPALRGLFATPPAGTPQRQCFEVTQSAIETRSGEFLMGGFVGGERPITARRPAKIWWVPLHGSADMPPLEVRGRSLSTPTDTLRVLHGTIAFPPAPEEEREYFYPSDFVVPESGRWLLIAASGANWGCFILTVQ